MRNDPEDATVGQGNLVCQRAGLTQALRHRQALCWLTLATMTPMGHLTAERLGCADGAAIADRLLANREWARASRTMDSADGDNVYLVTVTAV